MDNLTEHLYDILHQPKYYTKVAWISIHLKFTLTDNGEVG